VFCLGSCAPERLQVAGARVTIQNMSLFNLILTAWRIKANQLSGPDWMMSQKFDIIATIPQGATKDRVPEMLQALLSERFTLAFHRERKEQSVLALVVGRNGIKLRRPRRGRRRAFRTRRAASLCTRRTERPDGKVGTISSLQAEPTVRCMAAEAPMAVCYGIFHG
jgi:uncharacterized protein (TIGR03435 family)